MADHPGDSVTFTTVNASGGQFGRASTVADVAKLDFGLLADQFPEAALHHWSYDASWNSRAVVASPHSSQPKRAMIRAIAQ